MDVEIWCWQPELLQSWQFQCSDLRLRSVSFKQVKTYCKTQEKSVAFHGLKYTVYRYHKRWTIVQSRVTEPLMHKLLRTRHRNGQFGGELKPDLCMSILYCDFQSLHMIFLRIIQRFQLFLWRYTEKFLHVITVASIPRRSEGSGTRMQKLWQLHLPSVPKSQGPVCCRFQNLRNMLKLHAWQGSWINK